jgi:hypothetical protein
MIRRLVLSIAVMIPVSGVAQSDTWAPLRVFEGKWEGPALGQPGKGFSSREYRFVMDGHFLSQRDKTVYEAKSSGAKPVVHEDFGFFSYDASLKKFVWRQFHNEGMVNEYSLDSLSADGKSMEFVTTRIENLAPGWRAKKSYRILGADELEETFWLAPPGKDLEVYVVTRLKRVP